MWGSSIDTALVKYCDKFSEEHKGTTVGKLYNTLNQVKHQNMRQMINDKTTDYFKFSFVRNPWDKLVSVFHYERKNGT